MLGGMSGDQMVIEVDNRAGSEDRGGHRPRLRRRDRGAVIVEMAILLPMLVLLMIGILEFGGAFKDFLTTSSAVREGTRALSALGDDEFADCVALAKALEVMTTSADFDRIETIEIYKADANGDQIDALTNEYSYNGGDPDDCNNWTPVVIPYPPEDRIVLVGDVPLDIVGMRITYRHDWYTGFPPFNGFITIDEQTITRLEPEGFEP